MNKKRFEEIMGDDNGGKSLTDLNDDNACIGLQIIRKYCPTKGIEGADHDIIYSVDPDELVEAGITEEDAIRLRDINWMIDSESGCMACFV